MTLRTWLLAASAALLLGAPASAGAPHPAGGQAAPPPAACTAPVCTPPACFEMKVTKTPSRILLNYNQPVVVLFYDGSGTLSLQFPPGTSFGDLKVKGVTFTASSNLYLVCSEEDGCGKVWIYPNQQSSQKPNAP